MRKVCKRSAKGLREADDRQRKKPGERLRRWPGLKQELEQVEVYAQNNVATTQPEDDSLDSPPFRLVDLDDSGLPGLDHGIYYCRVTGEDRDWEVPERMMASYEAFLAWFCLEGIDASWPALEAAPWHQRCYLWLREVGRQVRRLRAR